MVDSVQQEQTARSSPVHGGNAILPHSFQGSPE